jgi:hypothetical protein
MEQVQCRQAGGSGIGPGHYEGAKGKDSCLRNSKLGGRIGSAVRGSKKGILTYAPSVSNVISQQGDADTRDMQWTWMQRKGYGLAVPEEVGMFRPATTQAHSCQQTGPTAVSCMPYNSSQAATSGIHAYSEQVSDLRPQAVLRGTTTVALQDNVRMSCKIQHRKCFPKNPPCPSKLLASASHCELPGEWDWNALNRSARQSFSAQAGGCYRNSRVRHQCATGLQRNPMHGAWVDRGLEGSTDTAEESSDVEQHRSPTSMQPIPEEGAFAPADNDTVESNRAILDCSGLVSEREIRSHELAISHAEEARAVDIRRRRWELYSSMYATVLPLLKKQIAMGGACKQLE